MKVGETLTERLDKIMLDEMVNETPCRTFNKYRDRFLTDVPYDAYCIDSRECKYKAIDEIDCIQYCCFDQTYHGKRRRYQK